MLNFSGTFRFERPIAKKASTQRLPRSPFVHGFFDVLGGPWWGIWFWSRFPLYPFSKQKDRSNLSGTWWIYSGYMSYLFSYSKMSKPMIPGNHRGSGGMALFGGPLGGPPQLSLAGDPCAMEGGTKSSMERPYFFCLDKDMDRYGKYRFHDVSSKFVNDFGWKQSGWQRWPAQGQKLRSSRPADPTCHAPLSGNHEAGCKSVARGSNFEAQRKHDDTETMKCDGSADFITAHQRGYVHVKSPRGAPNTSSWLRRFSFCIVCTSSSTKTRYYKYLKTGYP